MVVGGRLRELRETKQLSQGDIENRTGLLRCYISRVEHKKQNSFVAGKSDCPSAPSRAPGYGVHWSGAETLDGRSGRISRSI